MFYENVSTAVELSDVSHTSYTFGTPNLHPVAESRLGVVLQFERWARG